jgi:phosphate transport system substrate-binding protein
LRVINKRRHQILQEHVVGWDALSVVVHPDNPLVGVTIEQLAQIYSGDSELQRWSDLGITVPGCDGQAIVAGSRRPSSGTYQFFRDVLFQEKRRKLNGRRHYQESSHAMIAWVARTPCAIGYSGIGHVTGAVRTLCIRPDPARQECIMPSLENTRQTSYPMMRPLYIYLLTEPTQALRDYLAWIMGPDGRAILRQKGFIDGVMAEMTAPATDNK